MNNRSLKSIVFGAVFLVMGCACLTTPAQAQMSNKDKQVVVSKFLDYFKTIVFGAEYDKKQASTIIYKWQGPVRIYLQYSGVKPNPQYREFIKDHAITLRRVTRLPILLIGNPKLANIKIIFVKRARMGKLKLPQVSPKMLTRLASPGGCYFVAYKSGPGKKQAGRIHSSIIVVNAERDISGINHCLLEEIVQSIGMPNDSNKLRPSIFSDKDRLFELSPVDKIMLRVLYDNKMKMGMKPKQAQITASKITTALLFGGNRPATSRKKAK